MTEVAAKLPMMTVTDMIGIPESQVETFARAGDNLGSMGHSDVLPEGVSVADFAAEQLMTLVGIGAELVKHRGQHPTDDLATALAQATIDGRPLTIEEVGAVMVLLSVAGNGPPTRPADPPPAFVLIGCEL